MSLTFEIKFELNMGGNNKLHADVLLNNIKSWLEENLNQNEYIFDSKISLFHERFVNPYSEENESCAMGTITILSNGPTCKVKILFLKEEDRNLFQLLYNVELNKNGARNLKTNTV